MQTKMSKLCKGDLLIVAVILLLAVAVFIWMIPRGSSTRKCAEIYLDGVLIERITLTEQTNKSIEIDEIVHNTIEIDGTKVRILHATCADHVCEHMGAIDTVGQVLVCMPNKLLVKVVGEQAQQEYDVVVG